MSQCRVISYLIGFREIYPENSIWRWQYFYCVKKYSPSVPVHLTQYVYGLIMCQFLKSVVSRILFQLNTSKSIIRGEIFEETSFKKHLTSVLIISLICQQNSQIQWDTFIIINNTPLHVSAVIAPPSGRTLSYVTIVTFFD